MDWKAFARSVLGDSSPRVRPMVQSDLDEVLRIIRLHDSDDYRAAKRAFASARFDLPEDVTQHFVLENPKDAQIVGVSGYFVEDTEARGIYWLGWTYVNPFHRNKGYGAMLVHLVMRSVQRFGARKLYLSTSDLPEYAEAVRFYQKFGFREEGRLTDYFEEGEAKLIMGVSL